MANVPGTSIYGQQRTYFLNNLEYQVYDLRFRPETLPRIISALGELHAMTDISIEMAALCEDHCFEKICQDLKPILHAAILALRRDGSVEARLHFASQLEEVVPLSIRDPLAYARAQAVQRHEAADNS